MTSKLLCAAIACGAAVAHPAHAEDDAASNDDPQTVTVTATRSPIAEGARGPQTAFDRG